MDVYISGIHHYHHHIPMILNFHILAFSFHFYQQVHMKKDKKTIAKKEQRKENKKHKKRKDSKKKNNK